MYHKERSPKIEIKGREAIVERHESGQAKMHSTLPSKVGRIRVKKFLLFKN